MPPAVSYETKILVRDHIRLVGTQCDIARLSNKELKNKQTSAD